MTLKSTILDHVRDLEAQGLLFKYQPSVSLDPGDEKRCLYVTSTVSRLLKGETVERDWQTDFLSLRDPQKMIANAEFRRFMGGRECCVVGQEVKSDEDPDWKLLVSKRLIVWEIRFRGLRAAYLSIRYFGFFLGKDVFVICCLRHKDSLNDTIYTHVIEKIEEFVCYLRLDGVALSGAEFQGEKRYSHYDRCLSNWRDVKCLN